MGHSSRTRRARSRVLSLPSDSHGVNSIPWNRDGDYDVVVMSEKVSFGMSDNLNRLVPKFGYNKHSILY